MMCIALRRWRFALHIFALSLAWERAKIYVQDFPMDEQVMS